MIRIKKIHVYKLVTNYIVIFNFDEGWFSSMYYKSYLEKSIVESDIYNPNLLESRIHTLT